MEKIPIINPKTYKPIRDRLYKERVLMRVLHEDSFRICFKRDVSKKFFGMMTDLYAKDRLFRTNTIISVSGLTGSGKSIAIMSVALYTCPKWTQENMKFFDQELLDLLGDDVPEDTLIIRDENPAKAIYGEGSNRLESQIDVIGDTCRKHGLSIFFIEPEFKKYDIAKWYLETIDMGSGLDFNGKERRVVRVGLREPKTERFVGSVLIPVVDDNNKEWVKYNERKDIFIKEVLKSDYKGSKLDYEEIAQDLINEIDLSVYNTKAKRKLIVKKKFPSITIGEMNTILGWIEIQLLENKSNK